MTAYQARAGSTADLAMGHLEQHGPTGEIALAAAIDKELSELGGLLMWPIKQGALKKEVVGGEWVYSMGDGVPVAPARETIERAATKVIEKASRTENTPPRGLTAMQARGEVMEPEGCASPTGRGGDAAPARAAGPASMHASQAGPASDGSQKPNGDGLSSSTAPAKAGSNTPRRGSQHVLKAEAGCESRPDATDRETPANASPVGGPMGAGQPAAAGPTGALRIALWSDGTLEIVRSAGEFVERITFPVIEARQLVGYLDAIALDAVREGAAA